MDAAYQEREPGLSEHLSGIVLNPMNQAAASKVVLFTAADFLWNEHAYDHERSERHAAGYLADGDAATIGALLTFFDLNHLAPTFGDAPRLPQAPALAQEIDEFWAAWDAGDEETAAALFQRAEAQIQEAGSVPGDPRPRPQGTVRLADGVLDVFLDDLRAAAG